MTHQLDEKEIFHVATSFRDGSQRTTFLNSACGNDSALRQRVEALLAAHDLEDEDFLSRGAPVDDLDADASIVKVGPGSTIGRYKILEQIGEGGFGTVYMADQQEPIQRRVALKIIKAGMDSKQVIARFEAERQALALMDHSNIAKVLDAGTTESGHPFFVMELVRGIHVTEYCDDQNLRTDERLQVFLQVCSAIQHAHQKGIIHRDIKPSNILVSTNGDRPMPKVIDFGIAKATQGRLTDKTLFTQFRQFAGTPVYMSPEQAQLSVLDVDTRSDIYSLGVLLYELLTGTTPLDSNELSSAGFEEVCRRIREVEPPKPSTRLSSLASEQRTTIAKHRRTDPERLRHLIRGELDWIVTKAMEKDRSRRYATASALADDIASHLRGEPVAAVPPSPVYRLQKFVRRNKTTMTTVGFVATALIVGTVVASWQAYVANSERIVADQARNEANGARIEAVDAKILADQLTRRAEAGEANARQIAYATDVALAEQALQRNNMRLARQLLNRSRSASDETALGNWEWRALWRQCQGDALSTFGDLEYVIWSASLSPDDRWLATGSLKGEIRVWDMQTHEQVAVLAPPIASGKELGRVAFSSQGDRLFASTQGGTVKVWNVPDWSMTDLQFSHGDRVRSISLSSDAKKLAVFGFDEMVTLWNVDDPAPINPKRLHVGDGGGIQTGAVAISPDGKWLAVGLGDGSIRVFDLATPTQPFSFPSTVPSELIKTLAFSPDSQILASGTGFADGGIDLWSIPEQKLIRRLQSHTDYLCGLAFSPDGGLLASASADQTIRLWNTEDWKNSRLLRGHQHEVWAVKFTSDGRQLVSGGKDGDICTWNVEHEAKTSWPITLPDVSEMGFQGLQAKHRVSFSPDSLWLATRNRDRSICLRTTENLQETHRLTELGTNHTSLLYAPWEGLLFVGKTDGSLAWLDPLQPHHMRSHILLPGATIYVANFACQGKKLLVIAEERTESEQSKKGEGKRAHCVVWSVEDNKQIASWEVPANLECAAVSPDGTLVVTGHYDGTLRFWPTRNPGNSLSKDLRDHVRGLAFSPTGELLATVNEYGTIEIWDVPTRATRGTLHGNMKAVFDVKFSPDGTRLVTAGSAGESVKLWDLATRQEVATLVAPGYSFGQVDFSPDGNAILVLNIDGWISMWRPPSKEYILASELRAQ